MKSRKGGNVASDILVDCEDVNQSQSVTFQLFLLQYLI